MAGCPPAFSSVNLYSQTDTLCLPVSSVVGEFNATKLSTILSENEKVRHVDKTIKYGREWKPQEALRDAETYWMHQEIVEVVCQGQ